MLGSVQLGFYSLAFQFSALPIDKLVTIVSQVAFPSFSALQHDTPTLRRYYLKLTSIIALGTFPILVGVSLVGDMGVELLLTTKWLPVVVPLQILCIVSCLRAVEMLSHPLVLAKGQPRVSLLNGLLQSIVLPIAFLIGVRDGLRGVALAWLVTRPFVFAFVTILSVRTIGLPFATYLGALRHPVGGCVAMALAVMPTRALLSGSPLTIQLTVSCAVGALAYAGYQLLCNRPALREALDVVRTRGAVGRLRAEKVSEATPAA
jgi:O-antigen/teichoic acid export membrane protein